MPYEEEVSAIQGLGAIAITNPHSPNEHRINGVVSNMPEFAAAFACKIGRPILLERVCWVW